VRRCRSIVQQRLTILLELELNLFPNNYLYRKVYVFPGEDTAGAVRVRDPAEGTYYSFIKEIPDSPCKVINFNK